MLPVVKFNKKVIAQCIGGPPIQKTHKLECCRELAAANDFPEKMEVTKSGREEVVPVTSAGCVVPSPQFV